MLDKYIVKDGKKLRYGYTTGSCAAAASKAAAIAALNGKKIDRVTIDTPKGWKLELEVKNCRIEKGRATCSVEKDGGDDPDNTHGILITSTVEIINAPKIVIKGGEGVGVVMKPGLPVAPGNPAINPVPQRMIQKEVLEVIPKGQGAIITISVPDGEKIAQKTFNPRLGILHGISILGTTGIVEPMSEEALKASLAMEVSVAAHEGIDRLILVPGNHGKNMALQHYGLNHRKIIKTSNFVGFMLEKCVEYGIKKVLMIGHIGKFIKLAGGIFHTHSKIADARIEVLAANLALLGAETKMIQDLFQCVTTDAALELIEQWSLEEVYQVLCDKAEKRCEEYVYQQLEVGVIMFSLDKRILGVSQKAHRLLEEF